MDDTPKQIQKKINKYAFSGGQALLEDHRKYGGNPDVDVAYQYMSFFSFDDDKLEKLAQGYRKGEILSSEMKKECIEVISKFVTEYQQVRATVDDELVKQFMTPHKLSIYTKERLVPAKQRTKNK